MRGFFNFLSLFFTLLPLAGPIRTKSVFPFFLSFLIFYAEPSSEEILKLHQAHQGSTFCPLQGGNMSGKDFYAIGFFPEHAEIFFFNLNQKKLQSFLEKHSQLFLEPSHCIGTWTDYFFKFIKYEVLDVVKVIPRSKGLEYALKLAQDKKQKAFFDLKEMKTIFVSKTK